MIRKKLKICHIGWASSMHVERLMSWFATKGHDVSIITNTPKKIPGVRVYDLKRKPDNRPRWERYKDFYFNVNWQWLCRLNEVIRIRRLVNEISPDIIHSHSLWYPGYLGVYINGFPFVLTVLNGDVLWKNDDIDIYTRLRTRWGIKKANIITAESEELRNGCIKHGADKEKVHLSGLWGVNLKTFNRDGNKYEIRRNLSLPENSKIVLSPRNTASFYNLNKIVEAMPKVVDSINDACFVFIWHGNDPQKAEELTTLATQLGVQNNIKIVGFVNHDLVALYHKAADVMVSVSKYDSGPMALKESMACGDIPVITNLPCVRELIKDGWNGLLVEPDNVDQIADSIVKLLEDQEMRKTFNERNWKLIQEKGDQEYWMGKMEDIYHSLLDTEIGS